MKSIFEKPAIEVVQFNSSIIALSNCSCYYPPLDPGEGDETCTGANASCSCEDNYGNPNANCE